MSPVCMCSTARQVPHDNRRYVPRYVPPFSPPFQPLSRLPAHPHITFPSSTRRSSLRLNSRAAPLRLSRHAHPCPTVDPGGDSDGVPLVFRPY